VNELYLSQFNTIFFNNVDYGDAHVCLVAKDLDMKIAVCKKFIQFIRVTPYKCVKDNFCFTLLICD